MPRRDPITQSIVNFGENVSLERMKTKLVSQIAYHEKAIEDIKKELDAISILEKSKYLNNNNEFHSKNILQHALSLESVPTVTRRFIIAIENMGDAKFGRDDLRKMINNDGNGEMSEGTFSVYFPRMVKSGHIEVVEEGSGRTKGIYTKGNAITH